MKHQSECPYFTFSTRGTTVHYELYEHNNKKERPTFVLVHGFLSSSFSYRRLIPLLAQEGTVIALDLPPFGKSDKSNQFKYSYHNLATIIIDLVEHLQLSNIVLVGHSMGGQISLYVNHIRPDLITKTILLCSSSYLHRANLPLIYSSYLPFFHLYVKNWIIRRGVVHNLMNVVHDHSLIDDEMMKGYAAPFYDNRIFPALTRMIRDREGDLSPAELREIKTPTLLIWGEKDRVVPVHIGHRLHKDLPNSKFISYENVGHLLPEEKPEHVYEEIMAFSAQ
ncbi:alpha/beta hydrolase [Bacillus pseudomycoides]|uniref:Alpha/beta hydrolase n=1 Tax=Bacillus pseudomycoides TaxID=64104 RepID=A0AA91VBQ5_9BACI|nr:MULTISPECIES: alpha/beta hydrolase [Bacillus]PEB50542.1 alpha/beta hydrolase [Bacillus sp. AFS098217]PED81994.1 alpha/beta hydrolase [Bacillus pseudomycoides]PEU05662.1 alpha/beta hydrolase [Bacillus sp. AFS019443]PEU10505.1 alpha/beta hydrolase [Bacillus sp. AFS014408]PFW61143.1 alpha/beta hydrolase [Bacillus sp. AFS075034]